MHSVACDNLYGMQAGRFTFVVDCPAFAKSVTPLIAADISAARTAPAMFERYRAGSTDQ